MYLFDYRFDKQYKRPDSYCHCSDKYKLRIKQRNADPGNSYGRSITYTYSVDGSVFTTTINYTGLASGSHTIEVKDQNGCIFSTTASLSNTNGPATASAAAPAILCNGGTTTITVTAGGGTTPLQYSLDG
jgi:hypothetical protein